MVDQATSADVPSNEALAAQMLNAILAQLRKRIAGPDGEPSDHSHREAFLEVLKNELTGRSVLHSHHI